MSYGNLVYTSQSTPPSTLGEFWPAMQLMMDRSVSMNKADRNVDE